MIFTHLRSQMSLFRDAWLLQDAWKKLLDDNNSDNLYSDKDIFNLRRKSKYLFRSLDSIVRMYHKHTITECVSEACVRLTIMTME